MNKSEKLLVLAATELNELLGLEPEIPMDGKTPIGELMGKLKQACGLMDIAEEVSQLSQPVINGMVKLGYIDKTEIPKALTPKAGDLKPILNDVMDEPAEEDTGGVPEQAFDEIAILEEMKVAMRTPAKANKLANLKKVVANNPEPFESLTENVIAEFNWIDLRDKMLALLKGEEEEVPEPEEAPEPVKEKKETKAQKAKREKAEALAEEKAAQEPQAEASEEKPKVDKPKVSSKITEASTE